MEQDKVKALHHYRQMAELATREAAAKAVLEAEFILGIREGYGDTDDR
jgi:hypothetical protein